MLLPKGGVTWKSAQAKLPPTRVVWRFLTQTRVMLSLAIMGIVILLYNGLSGTAGEMQKYVYQMLKSELVVGMIHSG
jgi:hypothetical protein